MSTLTIYTKDDEGNLAFLAEAEDYDGTAPDMLIDELLDENPEIEERSFVLLDSDNLAEVNVESDEPVQPRRKITVVGVVKATRSKPAAQRAASGNGRRKGAGGRKPGPKKGSTRRASASKSAPAASKKKAGRPAIRSGGGSSFTRNAASDE